MSFVLFVVRSLRDVSRTNTLSARRCGQPLLRDLGYVLEYVADNICHFDVFRLSIVIQQDAVLQRFAGKAADVIERDMRPP